jgi:hypothetical protein
MAAAAAEIFFSGNASKETELGMGVELNGGRNHGGILGGQGRRSQSKQGFLIVTINLNGHVLIFLDIYSVRFYVRCVSAYQKYQNTSICKAIRLVDA